MVIVLSVIYEVSGTDFSIYIDIRIRVIWLFLMDEWFPVYLYLYLYPAADVLLPYPCYN